MKYITPIVIYCSANVWGDGPTLSEHSGGTSQTPPDRRPTSDSLTSDPVQVVKLVVVPSIIAVRAVLGRQAAPCCLSAVRCHFLPWCIARAYYLRCCLPTPRDVTINLIPNTQGSHPVIVLSRQQPNILQCYGSWLIKCTCNYVTTSCASPTSNLWLWFRESIKSLYSNIEIPTYGHLFNA